MSILLMIQKQPSYKLTRLKDSSHMTILVDWARVLTSGVCLHEKLQNLTAEQQPHTCHMVSSVVVNL